MIKNKIELLFYFLQIMLLNISYLVNKLVYRSNKSWVIGVDEIASNIYFLKNILKPSVSVSFSKNKFYDLNYDYFININNKYLSYFCRVIYGPILLGYLSNKHSHFWYIWNTGFLIYRDYEFKFLKSKNKKIVCMFVGDDIRSIELTNRYSEQMKIDMQTHYVIYENKKMLSNSYEKDKKKLSLITDKYADFVFSHAMCQMSYLKSKQYSWPYMYDKSKFIKNDYKFNNLKNIKILHSPSSLLFKGTSLVRAAIKKLEIEKYNIEYVELQNMSNQVVLEHLKSSHIVLNQFYCFTPGLFGIEAMANHCAVLMSADPSIETGLPQDSKDAWLITKYWEVYDNLKYLLDNPEKIKYYADRGYDFAYKHYTYEAAGEYINTVLKENGVIE